MKRNEPQIQAACVLTAPPKTVLLRISHTKYFNRAIFINLSHSHCLPNLLPKLTFSLHAPLYLLDSFYLQKDWKHFPLWHECRCEFISLRFDTNLFTIICNILKIIFRLDFALQLILIKMRSTQNAKFSQFNLFGSSWKLPNWKFC